MSKHICIECQEIYLESDIPTDFVCKKTSCPGNGLTGLIIPLEGEEPNVQPSIGTQPYVSQETRECGLCVLLMDGSGSMFLDPPFKGINLPSTFGEEFCNKAEIVCKAAANAIFELKPMTHKDNAYLCAISFDHSQAMMFNDSIDNIIDRFQEPLTLANFFYNELKKMKGGTDINSALKMAESYVSKFLIGDIPGMGKFSPMTQQQWLDGLGKSIDVPNVRVMIYTDGEQLPEYGAIQNYFTEKRHTEVDLLMGAFIGDAQDSGCEELRTVLSDCPLHNSKQFFVLDTPQKMAALRGLFRMASGTSGFCPNCLPNQTTVLR